MMSLVGCSGEEFSAILRSLGFRMLKRPVPAAGTDVKESSLEAARPAEEGLQAPPDETAPQESVERAEPPSSEALPAAEASSPSEQEAEPPAAASASNGTAPEPAASEAMIEIWWPKDTGPFRQQHQHQKARKKFPPSQKPKQPEPSSIAKPHKPPRPEVRKSQKPDKPVVNPDSPFAVLGALRSQLAEKKNA
jgi:ATP-dependent RNA helicase SUPV3L1/SUV3